MIMLTTVETRALGLAAQAFRRSPGMQAEQFVVDAIAGWMDAAVEAQRLEDGGLLTERSAHDNPTYHAPPSAEADGPAGAAALPPEQEVGAVEAGRDGAGAGVDQVVVLPPREG